MSRYQEITIRTRAPRMNVVQSAITMVRQGWQNLRSYTMPPLTLKSPELARAMGWHGETDAGVHVNEFTAMNYAAVYCAVDLLSGTIGSLPLFPKRRSGHGWDRATNHRTYNLLHDEPNPEMSSMVMRETLMAHCLTWGNGYAEIERDQVGRPIALWPLLPNQTTPFRDAQKRLMYRAMAPDAPDAIIPAADMIHVHGLGFDGLIGYSPIQHARQSIALGLAAQQFGATFYKNGASFGGILVHPKTIKGDGVANLKASINEYHQGSGKAHRLLVLEEGMDYKKLGVDPESAQFLGSRQFEITEIARWYGVPPHKLMDLAHATFSNIEAQQIDFVQTAILKWVRRWESELRRKLLTTAERQSMTIEMDIDGMQRGDQAARSTYYREQFNIGAITINEIRALEGRTSIGPDGDVHFVQANVEAVGRVIARQHEEPVDRPAPEPAEPVANDDVTDDQRQIDRESLIRGGWSVDEVRVKDGLQPIGPERGGDRVWLPRDLQPTELRLVQPAAAAEPESVAPPMPAPPTPINLTLEVLDPEESRERRYIAEDKAEKEAEEARRQEQIAAFERQEVMLKRHQRTDTVLGEIEEHKRKVAAEQARETRYQIEVTRSKRRREAARQQAEDDAEEWVQAS